MKMHRRLFLLAAAAVAMAMSGNQAGAAYTYTTSLVITAVSGGAPPPVNTPGVGATATSASGGSAVTLQDITTPGTFLVPGSLTANIGNIGVGTTSATPESFTVNYTDTITITNPAPAGATGSFVITGVLTFTNLQNVGGATGGTVSNVYTGVLNQGPITITAPTQFTMNFGTGAVNDFFGPPTIGTSATLPITTSGSLGAQINAVPEPTSMALIGIGLTGLLGYSWRRREVARRLAV